ncbi:unnamed protein product [Symbiodinium natans]|uniref:Uncharacterized protein n=1 Tax=Symbiodinium natans TaxID=878477 RepID=A0A812MH39_9DINO|nr:unnamed protein product [Symbiodinium natans]
MMCQGASCADRLPSPARVPWQGAVSAPWAWSCALAAVAGPETVATLLQHAAALLSGFRSGTLVLWSQGVLQLMRDLVRVRAQRAPPALRQAAASAWARRWWSQVPVSVQQAVASTALGCPWPVPRPSQRDGPGDCGF